MVNGRTVAEDMERECERAVLRDHFAAAALTGLLAQGDDGSFSEESYARAAYRWADTMLRERYKTSAEKTSGSGSVTPESYARGDEKSCFSDTNHDAAPAARAPADRYVRRAAADGDSDRTDKAAPRPSEGTGNTPAKADATQPPRATPAQGSVQGQ